MIPATYAERVLLHWRDHFRREAGRAAGGFAIGIAGMFAGTQEHLNRTLLALGAPQRRNDPAVRESAARALEWLLKLERWFRRPYPGRFAELKAVLHELIGGHETVVGFPTPATAMWPIPEDGDDE